MFTIELELGDAEHFMEITQLPLVSVPNVEEPRIIQVAQHVKVGDV